MIITRTIEFAMGHRLQRHGGLCKYIHGHNYVVDVEIFATQLDEQGMVIDFHDLKVAMESAFKQYDHAFVIEVGDPFGDLRKYGWDGGTPNAMLGMDRIIEIGVPPTAECLAKHWFGLLDAKIGAPHYQVHSVTVHESSKTSARYESHVPLLPNR